MNKDKLQEAIEKKAKADRAVGRMSVFLIMMGVFMLLFAILMNIT